MSSRNELSGRFSENWVGRNRGNRVGAVDAIVGAIAFMADTQIAQVQLNALGYPCGAADGKLGPATAAALKKFQAVESLPQTSTTDEATKQRLYERTSAMALKLPGGTPIAAPKGPTLSTSNTAVSSDVLDQFKKDLEAASKSVEPAVADPWKSGTPAMPDLPVALPKSPVPGVPGIPPNIIPGVQPPVEAKVPVEQKIMGLAPKTFYTGLVAAGVLGAAAVGAKVYMDRKKVPATVPGGYAPRLSVGPNTAITGAPRTLVTGG